MVWEDDDNDELDGCELEFKGDETPDEDIDGVVLFSGVDLNDPVAVEIKKAEWEELANGL